MTQNTMKTILIIKLLITLSIINFLKTNKNIEFNKFDIEFIQLLVKDKLKILFPTTNIEKLLYLVKLILLEISSDMFKASGVQIKNNDSNLGKEQTQPTSLDLEFNDSLLHSCSILDQNLIVESDPIILDCLKKFNQEDSNINNTDYPILIFSNSFEDKAIILKNLNNLSGIYCWYCKVNGNMYVGSAINLRARVGDYFQPAYIRDRQHLPIVRAMQKHGMDNFSLIILEFNNKKNLIISEQYWIDSIVPIYNILKIANSWLGHKHLETTKQKIYESRLGKTHSNETRIAMSLNRQKEKNSFFGKKHTAKTKELLRQAALNRTKPSRIGVTVYVYSLENDLLFTFKSITEMAKHFTSDSRTIRRYLDFNLPFRGKYLLKSQIKN